MENFKKSMTTSYGPQWKGELIKSFYTVHHYITIYMDDPPEGIKVHLDTLMAIAQALDKVKD